MGKTRSRMSIAQRAKQFMPFAALKGLEEAIENKERELEAVERTVLSSFQKQEINDVLCLLKKGDEVTVTFYNNGFYDTRMGYVKNIDELNHSLYLETEKIKFDDIYSIIKEN